MKIAVHLHLNRETADFPLVFLVHWTLVQVLVTTALHLEQI
jgi:hypothetical protein